MRVIVPYCAFLDQNFLTRTILVSPEFKGRGPLPTLPRPRRHCPWSASLRRWSCLDIILWFFDPVDGALFTLAVITVGLVVVTGSGVSVHTHDRTTLVTTQTVPLPRKQRRSMTRLRLARQSPQFHRAGSESGGLRGIDLGRGRDDAVHPADAAATRDGRRLRGSSPLGGGRPPRTIGPARPDETEQDGQKDDGVQDSQHEDEDHGLVERHEDVRVAQTHHQRRQQRRRSTVKYRQRYLQSNISVV